ncbi:MAG: metal-binding protein [Spirochaetales bacterium]|nr:metal-binding protein [Spirochaetales bacterium]
MKNSHRFFENTDCKYHPCHKGLATINCLFCFCPLYPYSDCGGNYAILENGVKDCQNCTLPHGPDGWERVVSFLEKKQKNNLHHPE